MAGFGDAPLIQHIAVPTVCLLIFFLGHVSQLIFRYAALEPGPTTDRESLVFNGLLVLLWYTYYKACRVDPGRFHFEYKVIEIEVGSRWCRKCELPKPPRAHHCRQCRRCVPKMDHHCPWTGNCVSMTTFPHFLRFLVYANLALWYLGLLLWGRFYALYDARDMPAYLGPSKSALASLMTLSLVWSGTALVLGIMLITTVKNWMFNYTTIESWEIDRHETVAERAGRDWWDVIGPNGRPMRFERIEFPYDIGFFSNMAQAMGTRHVILWFFPFGNPTLSKDGHGTGWTWQENGFNREEGLWPPADPAKVRRMAIERPQEQRDYEAQLEAMDLTPEERKAAFLGRQERHFRRTSSRMSMLAELEEIDDYGDSDGEDGGPPWTEADADGLTEYGGGEKGAEPTRMHESADEDNVPLSELLVRRRRA